MSNKLKFILGCVFLCSVINNVNAKSNSCIYVKSNKTIHKKSKLTKKHNHIKLSNSNKSYRNKLHRHQKKHSADYMNGIASYYAPKFAGSKTASGKSLNMHELTAAHPLLPFGSKVKVTNLANNKSIYVIINDRMPKRSGHVIDLTIVGAKQLDMISSGVSRVHLEMVSNHEFEQQLMTDESSNMKQFNASESELQISESN